MHGRHRTRWLAAVVVLGLLAACTGGDDPPPTTEAAEVEAPGRPEVPVGGSVLAIGGGDQPLPTEFGVKVPALDIDFRDTVFLGHAAPDPDTLVFMIGFDRYPYLYRDGLVERLPIDLLPLRPGGAISANSLTAAPDGTLYLLDYDVGDRSIWRVDLDTNSLEWVVTPQVDEDREITDFAVIADGRFVIADAAASVTPFGAVRAVGPSGELTDLAGFDASGCPNGQPAWSALAVNGAGELAAAAASFECPAMVVHRSGTGQVVAGVVQHEPRVENAAPCPTDDQPFLPRAVAPVAGGWLTMTVLCDVLWLVTDPTTPPRPVATLEDSPGGFSDGVASLPDGTAWVVGGDAIFLARPDI